MRGTTIAVIRKFLCESCKESRAVYLSETASSPECCGQAMTAVVDGKPTKSTIFPYVTTHLDGAGTPITVDSLPHLRRLEKEYGVVVHGFSNERASEFKDLPVQRPGGREFER